MVERKIRIVESKYATSNGQVSGPVSSAVDGVENHGFSGDTDSEEEEEHSETLQVWIIFPNVFVLFCMPTKANLVGQFK